MHKDSGAKWVHIEIIALAQELKKLYSTNASLSMGADGTDEVKAQERSAVMAKKGNGAKEQKAKKSTEEQIKRTDELLVKAEKRIVMLKRRRMLLTDPLGQKKLKIEKMKERLAKLEETVVEEEKAATAAK